jgi:hypothetical protein
MKLNWIAQNDCSSFNCLLGLNSTNLLWRNPKSLVRLPRVQLCHKLEVWGLEGSLLTLSTKRGKGACWGSRIRLGRGTSYLVIRSCIQNQPTSWLEFILHSFSVGTSHGRPWTHLTHHNLDLGEATTFRHIVFSATPRGGYIRMALFPRTPKEESRNCPGLDSPRLWASITSCSNFGLGWGLKKSCSFLWELSNAMLHSYCIRRIRVDSWLLMVGSQTASLTPGPSFAHNLGCICPNGACEAILDNYTSRPFQWYKEHPNARCFNPWNGALSFWESRRTPSSHFWECEFHPHT